MQKNNNKAKYTPTQIANTFLEKAENDKIQLHITQLMYLVYKSYTWYLYFTDKDLFCEKIEAWECGAVIPSLMSQMQSHIRGNIIPHNFRFN